jgi:hypothetical protein
MSTRICACCRCALKVLIVCAALLLVSSNVAAAIKVFKVDGASGSVMSDPTPPTGANWGSDAFLGLPDGIDAASNWIQALGDDTVQLWVRGSTTTGGLKYYPNQGANAPNDRTATFNLHSHLKIYGGFAGSESSVDDRDPESYKTVLTGDIDQNSTLDSGNVYHVVTAGSGVDSSALLDGFTIRDGNADTSGSLTTNVTRGGGILIDGGAPVIRACTIKCNSAEIHGGGVACFDCTLPPELRNCSFDWNSAGKGGGVDCNCNVNVINCTFNHNSASV